RDGSSISMHSGYVRVAPLLRFGGAEALERLTPGDQLRSAARIGAFRELQELHETRRLRERAKAPCLRPRRASCVAVCRPARIVGAAFVQRHPALDDDEPTAGAHFRLRPARPAPVPRGGGRLCRLDPSLRRSCRTTKLPMRVSVDGRYRAAFRCSERMRKSAEVGWIRRWRTAKVSRSMSFAICSSDSAASQSIRSAAWRERASRVSTLAKVL